MLAQRSLFWFNTPAARCNRPSHLSVWPQKAVAMRLFTLVDLQLQIVFEGRPKHPGFFEPRKHFMEKMHKIVDFKDTLLLKIRIKIDTATTCFILFVCR